MKIVVISHKTTNLARTRKKLLQSFINKGYKVIGICPEKEGTEELEQIGVSTRIVQSDRISIGIFSNVSYFFKVKKILKSEKPDIVFSYTIKPSIIGSIAAKMAKVPKIYSMITGLGYVYSTEKLKVRFIRIFCNIGYKIAFKCNTKVIFQNNDDKEYFIQKNFLDEQKACVVNGSGVDMETFKFSKLPDKMNFLMIARMLDVKGVEEYCKAAQIIKSKYPQVTFTFLGQMENSYRGIDPKIINEYQEKNIVDFKGYKEDVLPFLNDCKVFVMPSYLKEGIPRTVLEAMAVGRPIITTNVSGCKETVKESKNGFLVNPRDYKDLAEKMEYVINHQEILEQMGKNSCNYAKERFEVSLINKRMLEIMDL